ncbi:RNI-like protein [Coniophora puteana RWD-64-598 SS2]|uniref:RNI-like protein n=1 Tax=Coniophora puteana (strain RWD-64-598) TaxID=741705 RepID=R7SG67_CONPW|nr:RNI-like protein [Coniophora puteana RWD-64-598 SS2]EIW74722.1 RNI-like protein [Coniophora puteana RWD-64-598 SS2]
MNPKVFDIRLQDGVKGREIRTQSAVETILEPLLAPYDPALLEEVYFSGNVIGKASATRIAKFLEPAKNLKLAHFASVFSGHGQSSTGETTEALEILFDVLKEKKELANINFSQNAIGPNVIDPVARYLEGALSLEVLTLTDNGLGSEGSRRVVNALSRCAGKARSAGQTPKLRVLNCRHNNIYLLDTPFKLVEVNGTPNSKTPSAPTSNKKSEDASIYNPAIWYTDAKKRDYGPSNNPADAWKAALLALDGLQELSIGDHNELKPPQMHMLANVLSTRPNITKINVEEGTIPHGPVSDAWVKAVRGWKNLRSLNIAATTSVDDDGEEDSGPREIVRVLMERENPKLAYLKLEGLELGADFVKELADAITKENRFPKLRTLILEDNDIELDDDGVPEEKEEFEELMSWFEERGGYLVFEGSQNIKDEDQLTAAVAVEEEEEEEEEKGAKPPTAAPEKPAPKSAVDKATDALADLLNKVHID